MPKLFNPTPRELRTMYAGVPFIFPPHKSVIIKTVRKPGENLNPDDIANACYSDLAAVGLQLVNEEDPASPEEMEEAGMAALEAFSRENILTFNEANLSNANQGLPKLRVPKDVRELQALLVKHFKIREVDQDTAIVGEEVLGPLRAKGKEERDSAMERARRAFQTGNFDELRAALGFGPDVSPLSGLVGKDDPGEETPKVLQEGAAPELDTETMETTVVEPEFTEGHSPGRPPRQARPQGKPGVRKGGRG